MKTKIVLVDANGGELELGPFNQGVVIETYRAPVTPELIPVVYDVATRKEIARLVGAWWWDVTQPVHGAYVQLFVHAVPDIEDDEEQHD